MYKSFIKEVIDFVSALTGVLLLSPLFILVTIALYIANQGKPFSFKYAPVRMVNYLRSLSLKP